MADPTPPVIVLLLLEDGSYVLQEDADLSGAGDGRIILREVLVSVKACESDFPFEPLLVGAALCGAPFPIDPATRGVRRWRPPQLPAPRVTPPRPAVSAAAKACDVALPIDSDAPGVSAPCDAAGFPIDPVTRGIRRR